MLFFLCIYYFLSSFFFNPPALFEFYTLSLHDALPISTQRLLCLECLVHPEVFYLRTRSKLCGGCFCRQWLPSLCTQVVSMVFKICSSSRHSRFPSSSL